MATGFNTQVGKGEYRLQFETDNKECYLLMQEIARRCVDGTVDLSGVYDEVVVVKAGSPCESCTRVAKPEECGNKGCVAWREWFLSRWEQIHNYGKKHKA